MCQLPPKKLSKELKKELLQFFNTHPPATFSTRLRCVLLDYLAHELRIGVPLYLPEFLYSLYDLFILLDIAATDFPHTQTPKH